MEAYCPITALHKRKGDHNCPKQLICKTRRKRLGKDYPYNCSTERTWRLTSLLGVTQAVSGKGKN